jgi:hypothetical protein
MRPDRAGEARRKGWRYVDRGKARDVDALRAAANARLTSAVSLVLMVLFALEIGTVVAGARDLAQLHVILDTHVIAGFMIVALLIPKLISIGYRLIGYYRGDPAFVRMGPPPPALRVIGPILTATCLVLVASGVLALLGPVSARAGFLFAHKVSFYLLLPQICYHTAAHLSEALRNGRADLERGAKPAGRRTRVAAVLLGLAVGGTLGGIAIGWVPAYLAHSPVGLHR